MLRLKAPQQSELNQQSYSKALFPELGVEVVVQLGQLMHGKMVEGEACLSQGERCFYEFFHLYLMVTRPLLLDLIQK